LSDDESLLLFRVPHILGAARDREACQPLLRLLRRPFDEVDALLGDAVTESLAKIATGVFDDDIDALFALIIDGSIDGFIREALFGAATFLTWERRIARDRFREFLVRFYEERPAENGDQAWAGCRRSACSDCATWCRLTTVPFVKNACPRSGLIVLSSMRTVPKLNARPTTSIGSRKTTSVTLRMCLCRWLGRAAATTSSTRKLRGAIWRTRMSLPGIPGATSDATIPALAGAARKRRNAA
jgi:hypothetical protein